MIKRKRQKITSPYGLRGNTFHKGIDLRCWNLIKYIKQPVIFPEKCRVMRIVYQEKWGYTVVVRTKHKRKENYILKFIHLKKPNLIEGEVYNQGDLIGYTTVTDYMKRLKYGEHLHFEVWDNEGHINPLIYFDERRILYD